MCTSPQGLLHTRNRRILWSDRKGIRVPGSAHGAGLVSCDEIDHIGRGRVAESWPDPVGRNVCRYKADDARIGRGIGPPMDLRYRLRGETERREWRKLDYWMDFLDGTTGWIFWMDLLAGPSGWNYCLDLLAGITGWTYWLDSPDGSKDWTDWIDRLRGRLWRGMMGSRKI